LLTDQSLGPAGTSGAGSGQALGTYPPDGVCVSSMLTVDVLPLDVRAALERREAQRE